MTDMDKETETALRASIKHWENNVAAERPGNASTSAYLCALCDKFNIEDADSCPGCPVQDFTGQPHCRNTPFLDASIALREWRKSPKSTGGKAAFKEAAQAELDFLKSLLTGSSEEPS